jgi:hypothetical protein
MLWAGSRRSAFRNQYLPGPSPASWRFKHDFTIHRLDQERSIRHKIPNRECPEGYFRKASRSTDNGIIVRVDCPGLAHPDSLAAPDAAQRLCEGRSQGRRKSHGRCYLRVEAITPIARQVRGIRFLTSSSPSFNEHSSPAVPDKAPFPETAMAWRIPLALIYTNNRAPRDLGERSHTTHTIPGVLLERLLAFAFVSLWESRYEELFRQCC